MAGKLKYVSIGFCFGRSHLTTLNVTSMMALSCSKHRNLLTCCSRVVNRRQLTDTTITNRVTIHTSTAHNVVRSNLPDVVIPEMPIPDFVFRDYQKFGSRPALINGLTGQTLTFPQVRDAVWKVSSGLSRHGIKKGDIVMIMSENCVEYVIAIHALLSIGATVTLANPLYLADDIVRQVIDSGASYLVTSERTASRAADVTVMLHGQIKKTIIFGEARGCVPFSLLMSDDGSEAPKDVAIDVYKDVAILPYSSGTTGLPKGVMLNHYAEVANIIQTDSSLIFKQREGSVQLGVLPFYHIFAIMVTLMLPLAWGQTAVIVPGFEPKLFLDIITKYKINMGWLVPPIVLFLNKHPLAAATDLSCLHQILSGAAPLGKEMIEEFRSKYLHCAVAQGYGLTETAPIITISHLSNCEEKPCSSGMAVAMTELKVVDCETKNELETNQEGEVCMRGPQQMMGYHNNPPATADMIDSDGWLHTGDIGRIDEDGSLYLTDRLKELIKYKGLQVPPAELEAIMCSHPAVADAGVVGLPDDEAGEIPKAFVALKPGADASPHELAQYVAEKVVAYKKLRGGVEIIGTIPRSAAGKILRRQLRELSLQKQ